MSTTCTVETALHPAVAQALAFTEAYQRHRDAHPALREAMCLRTQYPALMPPLKAGDVFAGGKAEDRIAYLGSMWWAMMPNQRGPGKQGGYCFDFAAAERYENPTDRAVISQLSDFWRSECTWAKIHETWDADMLELIRGDGQIAGGGCGFALGLDLERLVQHGIPGLLADVEARIERATARDDLDFLRALRLALELVVDVCNHYREQARRLVPTIEDDINRARMITIAESLAAIVDRAPGTLHEAMQLLWIYSVLACGRHIDAWRMDGALGDAFAADIDSGRLSAEEATELTQALWRQFLKHGDPAVCRVVIGGKGRRNEQNADRFCMAAMEATRRHHDVIPQLTLRFHSGQDPALMRKAFDVLGEGTTYPMLYNDDVNVPGVAKALGVSEQDAERYHPLGCGEYMITGASPSLLNVGWSVPKSLEAAMLNGRDAEGNPLGIEDGEDDPGSGLESLTRALDRQLAYAADLAARVHAKNNVIFRSDCAFLFASLLTDDCIDRGRSLFDGGVRYTGACAMAHGFTNCADALIAMQRLVYENGSATYDDVLKALAADFDGCETIERQLRAAPKFGNDNDEVDTLLVELWQRISRFAAEAGARAGLDFLTVSSVNPGGYGMGAQCGATADGRRAGLPFAIGNAPMAGMDTCGITAMLNSVAKIDPANGGATTNIKLGENLFGLNRPQLEALFAAYWKQGGVQAMVTVVNKADLEDAMAHPERHPHLLVRIGGWSARFVGLDRPTQEEIIRRTLY